MRRLLAVLLILSAFGFAQTTCVNCGGGAYSAGGTGTVNVLLKGDGAGFGANSSITDDATTVISTEPIRSSNGSSASINGIQIGAANNGFWVSGSLIQANQGGTGDFSFGGWTGANTNFGLGIGFSSAVSSALDSWITRPAANGIQLGKADAAAPVAQTLSFQSVSTGTSNIAGTKSIIRTSLGTGNAAGAGTVIQRPLMLGSGTTVQTAADAFGVGQSKTLSNTSSTAQAIATITLGSNAGGGASGIFTLVCTDGTNFDSETQSFNVSFVNKAGAVTVGTPAITTSTAANNSGSCTLGITAVANGNNIDIKVTPVFGTIVPTTVTLYPIITHSTNAITFD